MPNVSTDIANMALDLLSAGTVTNIEAPSTPTEDLLARWYNHCRRKLLRSHPWNFATKQAILSASSTTPTFGGKAFPVPADFVRLLYLQDGAGNPQASPSYKMGNVGTQRCILIDSTYEDSSSLKIVYVFDAKDVSRFDDLFVELLAYDIALAIAYKVTESNGSVDRVNSIKESRRALAQSIDGQEAPPVNIVRSRGMDKRRYLTTSRTDRIIF